MNHYMLSDHLLDYYGPFLPPGFSLSDQVRSHTLGFRLALGIQGQDMRSIAAEIAWIWSGDNYRELTASMGGYHEFILKEPVTSEQTMEAQDWMLSLAAKKSIPAQQAAQMLEAKFKELKGTKEARGADGKPDNAKAAKMVEDWLRNQGIKTKKTVIDRPAGILPGGLNKMLRAYESVHRREGNDLVIGSDQLTTVIGVLKAIKNEKVPEKQAAILDTAPLEFTFYNPGKLGKSDFSPKMNDINGLYPVKPLVHSVYFRPTYDTTDAEGTTIAFVPYVNIGSAHLVNDMPRVWAVMQGFCALVLAAAGLEHRAAILVPNYVSLFNLAKPAANDDVTPAISHDVYDVLNYAPVFDYTGKDMILNADAVLAAFPVRH